MTGAAESAARGSRALRLCARSRASLWPYASTCATRAVCLEPRRGQLLIVS